MHSAFSVPLMAAQLPARYSVVKWSTSQGWHRLQQKNHRPKRLISPFQLLQGSACNVKIQVYPASVHDNSGITGEEREERIVRRSKLHKAGDYIAAALWLMLRKLIKGKRSKGNGKSVIEYIGGSYREWRKANTILIITEQVEEWVSHET